MPLASSLLAGTPLLVDGAMGTELFARGLTAGDSPEQWNLERQDDVIDVHRAYARAGADIVLTNSFGGNRFRLRLHGLQDRVHDLNEAAARLARTAVDETAGALVAGSIGPTGELLEPLGSLSTAGASEAFAGQAAGLAAGGADLLWVETMSSLEEVEAALAGARSVCDLPIVVTLSFDTAGRTMMGVTATEAADRLSPLSPAALGANCGNNLADTEAAVRELLAAAPEVPVVAKANAGIPVFRGDRLHYTGTPEVMAAHAARMIGAGVGAVGGCCGTTPAHIALMRTVLDGEVDAIENLDPPTDSAAGPVEPTESQRTRRPAGPRLRRRSGHG